MNMIQSCWINVDMSTSVSIENICCSLNGRQPLGWKYLTIQWIWDWNSLNLTCSWSFDLWYLQIFPSNWPYFFSGKHLIPFLVLKMKDFWNFVLDNYILVFDAEQVYLKLQATNLKNKEVTVNPSQSVSLCATGRQSVSLCATGCSY